jgi:pimeloyl-ACP methyl ester carboxylesterase
MNLSQAVRIAVQVIEKRYTEHRMKVNGLNIHYTDWGNPDSPHMFLAHGAVANAIYWDLVAPAFQADYHIVAVTARGRAKSDYSPTGSYETEDYVQDFRELTMALGMEKLTYLGQSMGGKIGMTYAAMYPDQVERMILVDVGGESTGSPSGDPMTNRPEVYNSPEEIESWLRQFDRFARISREAMDIVVQTGFQQLVNEQWISSLASPLAPRQRPATPPVYDVLNRIQCPTMLIHCLRSDLMGPEIAAKTRDAIPNCELVQMDSGHLPHLERPDEFIQVVKDFLGK